MQRVLTKILSFHYKKGTVAIGKEQTNEKNYLTRNESLKLLSNVDLGKTHSVGKK